MARMNNNSVIERKFRPIRVLKLGSISPVPRACTDKASTRFSFSQPLFPPLSLLNHPVATLFCLSSSDFSDYTLWLPLPTNQRPKPPPIYRASKPPSHVRIMAIQIANRFISPGGRTDTWNLSSRELATWNDFGLLLILCSFTNHPAAIGQREKRSLRSMRA